MCVGGPVRVIPSLQLPLEVLLCWRLLYSLLVVYGSGGDTVFGVFLLFVG